MKEKINASNNGRFKKDQTHGIGHIISNIKLLFLILKLSISIQFTRSFKR